MPRKKRTQLATAPPPDPREVKPPTLGEQTSRQVAMISPFFDIPGFGKPQPSTIKTYRKMRSNPTIAIARMAATAPIKAAPWSFEASDEAPKGAIELIENTLESVLRLIVREMLRSLDLGHYPFEIVWEAKEAREFGLPMALVPRKIKPLLPEKTEVLIDKSTGAFAGLKQGKVTLEPVESLLFTYDGEAGNFYGRPRNENIRKPWSAWDQMLDRIGKFTNKVAAVIPIIRHPGGTSKDASGADKTDHELAVDILTNLDHAKGVAWPMEILPWAEDAMKAGVDVSSILSWQITFLETKGQHAKEMTDVMRLLDSYLTRGWLVPERAVLEGQHGTKAEAGEHADIALQAAEEVLLDIALCINWYLIDKILILNYGTDAAGTVTATPAPLTDEQKAFFRAILKTVLTQPATVDLLFSMVNVDAMVERSGLPPSEADTPPLLPRSEDDVPAGNNGPLTASLQAIYRNAPRRLARMDI